MIINSCHNLSRNRRIILYFCLLFFLGKGVRANYLSGQDINKSSLQMYSQLSHTDTFVFIDDEERVYSPCMVRDPKGCPVDYPYIGNVKKRISRNVITLNNNDSYWCKTSLISNLVRKKKWNYHPHFFCDKDGWIENK